MVTLPHIPLFGMTIGKIILNYINGTDPPGGELSKAHLSLMGNEVIVPQTVAPMVIWDEIVVHWCIQALLFLAQSY